MITITALHSPADIDLHLSSTHQQQQQPVCLRCCLYLLEVGGGGHGTDDDDDDRLLTIGVLQQPIGMHQLLLCVVAVLCSHWCGWHLAVLAVPL